MLVSIAKKQGLKSLVANKTFLIIFSPSSSVTNRLKMLEHEIVVGLCVLGFI